MLSYRFIRRTEPSACGSEIKLDSNVVEFIDVAVVGAKNEALFPGRVPHVRRGEHGAPVQNRRPWLGDQIRQSSANLIWTSLAKFSP